MAETFTGKLSFDKGKWKIIFFAEKKQKDITLFCQKNVFAADFTPKESEETEVEFERDATPQKNAIKVREIGKKWSDAQTQPAQVPGQPAGGARTMKREFHNPYNFVPAPPRKTKDEIDSLSLSDEQKNLAKQLCDDEPSGHDRFLSDRYSGKLHVRMRVETPLLLPDTARVEVGKDDHKAFPVRVDANGRPEINPTAIKGMLRSAYEAITNSRLSIFQKHNERLAFRSEASSSQGIEPVRIDNERELHFYSAAWLGMYMHRARNWDGLAKHKNKVWVKVARRIHNKRRFRYFEVVDMADINSPKPSPDYFEGYVCVTNENIKNKHDERVFFKDSSTRSPLVLSDEELKELKDAWRTLIENYHEEHKDELNKPPASLGINKWSRQIYKANDEEVLKDGTLCYARMNGGKVKELLPVMISRRLHQVSPESLLPNNLKPVSLIENVKNKDGSIQYQSQMSPADRVFGCVRQKRKDKNGKDEPFKGKTIGYRGQVRIGAVTCLGIKGKDKDGNEINEHDVIESFGQAHTPDTWLPLNILGQPKPQQGRFYVAESTSGEAQNKNDKRNNEKAGFNEGRGLRGRKTYPHHANLPTDYWFEETLEKEKVEFQSDSGERTQKAVSETKPGFFREYLRPKSKENRQQRDSQNRSIQGWVKKDTEFDFNIHFTNLSKVELGALIWLLELEANHFHRFGGGKPFGFGSVTLSLAASEITSGSDLREFYQSLDTSLKQSITAECRTAFELAYQAVEYQRIIDAFLRASKGFADTQLPVHYPRARQYRGVQTQFGNRRRIIDKKFEPNQTEGEHPPPHKDGVAYEWFVENAKEKIELKGVDKNENEKTIELYSGKPVIRPRFVLEDLAEDKGLPILPHKIG